MTATLTFSLPDEEQDLRHALNGPEYYAALFTLQEKIRRLLKHGEYCEETRNVLGGLLAEVGETVGEM